MHVGVDHMKTTVPLEEAVATARLATILSYIKENQLVTALALFILWQSGALISVLSSAQGAMC